MKALRNRFLPLALVAGLAVFGVACEDDGAVDDPGIEDGAEDGAEDEGLDEGLDDEGGDLEDDEGGDL